MNELQRRGSTAPAIDMTELAGRLATGIADSRASTVIAGGGKPLLRLLKTGEWVFGASNEEVQPGSPWAINVLSLAHGWSCWVEGEGNQKNQLKGELLVPIIEPKPLRPPPIQGFEYAEVRAFELVCLDGDDNGTEVLHKTSSIGGMRAVDELLASITRQIAIDQRYYCPVITLESDSYQHQKWGKIFTPIFEIAEWTDIEGNPKPTAAAQIEDSRAAPFEPDPPQQPQVGARQAAQPAASSPPPPEPRSVGRPKKAPLGARYPAAAAPATATAAAASAPAPTAATHTGQRRRPAAR